jgi:hypothetical protein
VSCLHPLPSQDYANIKAGAYPLPWDMSLTNRQNNPAFILSRCEARASAERC